MQSWVQRKADSSKGLPLDSTTNLLKSNFIPKMNLEILTYPRLVYTFVEIPVQKLCQLTFLTTGTVVIVSIYEYFVHS